MMGGVSVRRGARGHLLVVSAAVWVLLAAPSADGATSLGQTGDGACSGSDFAEVQTSTGGPPGYAAPGSGLLTSWSVFANSDTDDVVQLRVFRPTSPPSTLFRVVGGSTAQGPLTPNVVNGPFPTSVRVQPGDLLGLKIIAGTSPSCAFATSSAADVIQEISPDDGAMGTAEFSTSTFIGARVNVSATFTPPPSITSVSPASGPRTGGTRVTVGGNDLTGATTLRFGGTSAARFTVDSDTQITAVSPPGALGPVDVRVTTPVRPSPLVAADRFTYLSICTVPKLKGKSLKSAKRTLRNDVCRIGKVKGEKGGKVRKQNPKPGAELPAGSKVNVKLS
jgi:IPT/TIG domain/PASTA domain